MPKAKEKPLCFAAICRVSTERQEKQGESLRTQTGQLENSVDSLSGKITKWFRGQEHATASFERKKLDELLSDAAKKRKPFDAVIVADPSRWSRDNVASETGLKILKDNGIRFFVLTTEYDLFDPNAMLFLSLSTTIGAFQASVQKQKSMLNRISRAKRGLPTCGKSPFGRVWNKEREEWSIDQEKKELIEDVAERYLKGERVPDLAKEFGMGPSNLHKILRERCGTTWEQRFLSADLNIDETIETKVPPLLSEKMIRLVHLKQKANSTHVRSGGKRKNEFLLSGYIFCSACGYAMSGDQDARGRGYLYYRHCKKDRKKECPLPGRQRVRADAIEKEVVAKLFDLFGNPAAIERAVKDAVPDCDKLLKKRERIGNDLSKIKRSKDRLINMVANDTITDQDAVPKLLDLKERNTILITELEAIDAQLADAGLPESVKIYAHQIGDNPGDVVLQDEDGNTYAGGNDVQSFLIMMEKSNGQGRLDLIKWVFGIPLPDGTPAGVYLKPAGDDPHGPKQFEYEIRGRLTDGLKGVVPYAWP